MENLNINNILDRTIIANNIKENLNDFTQNKNNNTLKKGIYIYGSPGVGKTKFVENILKDLNYDIIKYDAGDIRNKNVIDNITKHNMSDINVLSLLQKKKKQMAIIMDEIDGMNNGDKGGINALIKVIRPKKTKKQKLEDSSVNPIICIGNYHCDKKIKELMKVCYSYEIKCPTNKNISTLLDIITPCLDSQLKLDMINYIKGDLRKLVSIYNIYKNQNSLMRNEIIKNIFQPKTNNDDSKKITKNLINNKYNLLDHNYLMNETDRTIVGLLWHENIIDVIQKYPKKESFEFYKQFLENLCFADYIDRVTFQKQIWQFNEMSSLIKTMYNNLLFHKNFKLKNNYNSEIRFTKVLTKYSTEYNNSIFLQKLCDKLQMDLNDLLLYFENIKSKFSIEEIIQYFETIDVSKLDVNRIFRYIEKVNNYNLSNNDSELCEINN
jgi:DNA polymerase III delta prime subunit